MDITSLLSISLGAILVNNFILVQFLGICPFMGVSKKMDTAVGMGFAVIFVMGLASALCYPVNQLLVRHPGHRRPGAVRGDVPEEVHPHPL